MTTQRPNRRHDRSRGRPHQGGLTRDRVLAEALALIDRDGLEALTMRRLAAHLGVSPMAIYNHVRDKQDLLQGIANAILSQVDFSSDDPDWRERIRAGFRELRTACLAHPGAVRIMETVDVAPLEIFNLMEVTLGALEEVAISTEEATRAYFLLTNFTLGQVSYELRGPFPALDLVEAARHKSFAEAGFRRVERAASIANWDFDAAFEFGLSIILTGLERHQTT
jgi:AcrR family transcriptional regulator